MCLGTLGSVPQGGPFSLMETHNGKGGQRSELFCHVAASILVMGVQGDLTSTFSASS